MKVEKPVVGFEIHVELETKSKMFCGCPADHFGKKPNSQTCPVCLGLPGALPVSNEKAVDWTIMIGMALNCKVNKVSKFDRKHYFYPDLPKGYQISQYDKPFCTGGYLDTTDGRVRITRVHLEEDTGKLQHKNIKGKDASLVDFNRSGVPLVEIVTEPDIKSSKQAKEFGQKLRSIVRSLGVSDCDMEKGTMRLEANISLGMSLGYKVEVKNVNSFRFIGRSIDYEIERQKKLIEKGEIPTQETRGWDESLNKTKSQRIKEEAADYRYFPEPDIPPIHISEEQIEKIRSQIPELPDEVKKRWIDLGMREDYAAQLSVNSNTSKYIDEVIKSCKKMNVGLQKAVGMIVNNLVDITKVKPEEIPNIIKKEADSKIADTGQLEEIVKKVIDQLPKVAKDYQEGKDQAIGALIGKAMALSQGKADGKLLKQIFESKLRS
ncbi:Asp-tRNA(Asn)/Glu-tRNA(Gln) amidotransferase subunit GatB [Patescibacteria group bacterium]